MIIDYYRNYSNFYERLEREYIKYSRLIIAVDFDNTLYNIHNVSGSFDEVQELVKEWGDYAYIYIFTARTPDKYNEVEVFLKSKNIRYDAINESPPMDGFDGVKPFYSVLIDDRAGIDMAYCALTQLIQKIKSGEL